MRPEKKQPWEKTISSKNLCYQFQEENVNMWPRDLSRVKMAKASTNMRRTITTRGEPWLFRNVKWRLVMFLSALFTVFLSVESLHPNQSETSLFEGHHPSDMLSQTGWSAMQSRAYRDTPHGPDSTDRNNKSLPSMPRGKNQNVGNTSSSFDIFEPSLVKTVHHLFLDNLKTLNNTQLSAETRKDEINTNIASPPRTTPVVTKPEIPPAHLLTKSSESSSSSGDMKKRSSRIGKVTCRGRCGDRINLPCSCTDICFVNGNCCSDIYLACPEQVSSARLRFWHLRRAEVVCSSLTNTFMVMSCPGESTAESGNWDDDFPFPLKNATVATLNSIDTDTTPNILTSSKEAVSPGRMLLASHELQEYPFTTKDPKEMHTGSNAFVSLLLDTPVTDMTTDLMYRNSSIANCNGVLNSNLLFWKVQVPLLNIKVKPRNFEELNEIVTTNVVVYEPPDTLATSFAGSECISFAIHQCKPEYLIDQPELDSMCATRGITYYRSTEEHKKLFYKNIHCLHCNLGFVNDSKPVVDAVSTGRTFKLSVVASLSNNGNVRILNDLIKGFISWVGVECSLSTENQNSGGCFSTECSELYEQRPDGMCRKLTKVKYMIGADNCTVMRSQDFEEKLIALIVCYLQTYESAELSSESVRFNTVFDRRLNISLLEMSSEVYYEYDPPSRNSKPFLRELSMLIYAATNFCCGPPTSHFECSGNFCQVGEHKVAVVTSRDANTKIDWGLHDLDEEETTSDMRVVFCETNWEPRKRAYGALYCQQAPVYISQLDFLQRAANVSCFGDVISKDGHQKQPRRTCRGDPSSAPNVFLVCVLFVMLHFHLMQT